MRNKIPHILKREKKMKNTFISIKCSKLRCKIQKIRATIWTNNTNSYEQVHMTEYGSWNSSLLIVHNEYNKKSAWAGSRLIRLPEERIKKQKD